MDDTSTLLDSFGIAFATLRLDRDDAGDVRRLSLLSCNEAFTEQTGLGDGVGEGYLREAFGVGARAALGEFVEASEGRGRVFAHFYRSTSRWFSCYAQPLNGNELSVVLVDVTDYRADSALTQMREQAYRYFIEHLPMIAFLRIVSPYPHSLFTAGSFREITGYGPEQGSSPEKWIEIVHPDDKEMVVAAGEDLLNEPTYNAELEYRIVRRDGRIRWLHSYDRQFTSDDGTMQMVQGLILDITERKHQEEAL
ncbi:MAG: PAS domain-containing protein, partial [Spirochaetota bacterium]